VKNETLLTSKSSIIWSVVVLALPLAIYWYASTLDDKQMILVCKAWLYLHIAICLLIAKAAEKRVAVLAFVCWALQSYATFGKAYRTYFFVFLAFCAFAATAFEIFTGVRFSDYLAGR
jgi:hypothetical protein